MRWTTLESQVAVSVSELVPRSSRSVRFGGARSGIQVSHGKAAKVASAGLATVLVAGLSATAGFVGSLYGYSRSLQTHEVNHLSQAAKLV